MKVKEIRLSVEQKNSCWKANKAVLSTNIVIWFLIHHSKYFLNKIYLKLLKNKEETDQFVVLTLKQMEWANPTKHSSPQSRNTSWTEVVGPFHLLTKLSRSRSLGWVRRWYLQEKGTVTWENGGEGFYLNLKLHLLFKHDHHHLSGHQA